MKCGAARGAARGAAPHACTHGVSAESDSRLVSPPLTCTPPRAAARPRLQFAVVNGLSVGFLNLSLAFNSVGCAAPRAPVPGS
jgi:hypothetical protein